MEDLAAAIEQTITALEKDGLHVYDIGGGVLNVHHEPVSSDDSGGDASYLYTLTATITP
jgi:actin-like ATPase involved in cell morphogenesis